MLLDIEYRRNNTIWSHSYIERQYEVVCALSNGDISNDLDEPLTQFTWSLKVNLKNGASYGQVSIEH